MCHSIVVVIIIFKEFVCLALDAYNVHITLYTGERIATTLDTYTTPLTNISTNEINIPSTNSTAENMIILLLVTGVSIFLLVIVSVLAVLTTTIIAVVGLKWRKSIKRNRNTEQETVTYSTLMRQEYPDASTDDSPNHHEDIIHTAVDVSNKEQMVSNDNNITKNPPYMEETKRQVAIEDMYAVVNKQKKKKQNEDTPPPPPVVYSNTADRVYYNTAAIRKGHAVEDEETPPQIPPHANNRKPIIRTS
jgi:hypothetical protein